MKEREVYFLFTDTGTTLAKLINFFTKQEMNHVSISFSQDLKMVYSFGRKRPSNPFIGGFVLEDLTSDFLKNADCMIYSQPISPADYESMIKKIKEIEARQDEYRYNFIGLFGILFRVKIERRAALFCSQFVATVLQESETITFEKPVYFITPLDIRNHPGNRFVYHGKLKDYPGVESTKINSIAVETSVRQKQSFPYYISNLFKRFVMK